MTISFWRTILLIRCLVGYLFSCLSQLYSNISLWALTPDCRITEHAKPRWGLQWSPEVLRGPGPLPAQHGPLWMGHHSQVTAICGADACHPLCRTVGVHGIDFSRGSWVIHITQRSQRGTDQLLLSLRRTKLHQTCRTKEVTQEEQHIQYCRVFAFVYVNKEI